MATGKKYYWIKLKKEFLTGDRIDFLMSQKNGAQYVVLYLLLCMMCINSNGKLEQQLGEVVIQYDVDKIQRDCKYFNKDTVMVAMQLYRKLGLIYEDENGSLAIADYNEMIGSTTDYAAQKKTQRKRTGTKKKADIITDKGMDMAVDRIVDKTADMPMDKSVDIPVDNVHTEIRDKSIEIRDKSKDINNNNILARSSAGQTSEPEANVEALVLNDGSEWRPPKSLFEEYVRLYPAVDVVQQFRSMRSWCNSNPQKRKTARGIKRFVNSWLSGEQDKATRLYARGYNSEQAPGRSYGQPQRAADGNRYKYQDSAGRSYGQDVLNRLANEDRGDLNG